MASESDRNIAMLVTGQAGRALRVGRFSVVCEVDTELAEPSGTHSTCSSPLDSHRADLSASRGCRRRDEDSHVATSNRNASA
eukprot:CAMPEP_0170351974 /NCGR_PEP_ID=MMETSP0116_2-20130129/77296_1 /TAXON_ID=400756 /ORGANISM="Durinskia baltica, Strain CSIRO CS-38" /LENGTH=81 /DNA_ID=CAMNT_0010605895 /DNA_START=31 /DNA_END=272 /DNA_ORIENTATION=-